MNNSVLCQVQMHRIMAKFFKDFVAISDLKKISYDILKNFRLKTSTKY